MNDIDPEKQRQFAVDVVRRLRARGFEAYWAGGCVRDQLLGRAAKDYDVATGATPDEICDVFRDRRTLRLGAAFGVITVLGPRGAGPIEVTTFRQDAAYSDGRHPDAVTFSTPEEDAQRRDFTINGLFFDPIDERVIDFVDGQADLERRLIRAIGDPRQRFTEDKLRMLRAIRFAAKYEFAIEPATQQAIREMAAEVTVVSVERIAAEMRQMLLHPHRTQAVELLDATGLLGVVLPELYFAESTSPFTGRSMLAELAHLHGPSLPLALGVLLRESVDAVGAASICRRWKLSNAETQRTGWLVAHQHALFSARDAAWPRLQRILISDGIDELLALHGVQVVASELNGQPVPEHRFDLDFCRQQLARPEAELNPPALLTGNDLVAHGVPRGKIYQSLLEQVRDAQLEQRIATRAEALALVDRLLANPPANNSET